MLEHDLLATAWTWDGDEPMNERVRAVGDAGFAGIALALDDLYEVRATIGFARLRRMLDDAGIVWVQLGTLSRWWSDPDAAAGSGAERGVLLEAAATLSAWQVVARADVSLPGVSPAAMLDDWVALARQTEGVGAQLVLEPEPWSNLPTIERASRFVMTAGSGGVLLDVMHALRGGSTLASIRQGVDPSVLAAVELSDGLLSTPSGMTLAEESRSARHLPGAGAWDVPGIVRVARELGHDEPWGVEVRTPAHRALPVGDALRLAAAATRAVLDAADAHGAPALPMMPTSPAPTSAVDFEPQRRPRHETGSGAPA